MAKSSHSKRSKSLTKIVLSKLLKGALKEEDVDLEVLLDDVGNGVVEVDDGETIKLNGIIKKFGNSVEFKGQASVSWKSLCSYGNIEIDGETSVEMSEIFEPNFTSGQTYELKGEVIDVEEMIRDNLIPELPRFPVCESDGVSNVCLRCSNDDEIAKNILKEKVQPKNEVWSELEKLKFD